MICHLRCSDYSNHCDYKSSTHQGKMKLMSFDIFCLVPPGWSDSLLPESEDCDMLPIELLETFLRDVDTDTPTAQPAPAHHWGWGLVVC